MAASCSAEPFVGGFGDELADGGDLIGEFFGPDESGGGRRGGGFFVVILHGAGEGDLRHGASFRGVLEVGAEPADEAGALFGGALGVQRDEALKDLFVGELTRAFRASRSRVFSRRPPSPASLRGRNSRP